MARFDLDERDQTAAFDDEIDVSMARAVAALEDTPPGPLQPAFSDTLTQSAELSSLL